MWGEEGGAVSLHHEEGGGEGRKVPCWDDSTSKVQGSEQEPPYKANRVNRVRVKGKCWADD